MNGEGSTEFGGRLRACREAARLSQEQGPLTPLSPGVKPEQLASYQQAMVWFEAEYQVLLAAIELAAESGFNRHAWQLSWVIGSFLSTCGRYQELVGSQRTALAAATQLRHPRCGHPSAHGGYRAYRYRLMAEQAHRVAIP